MSMKEKLTAEFIKNLSLKKKEPEWMLNFRLKAYEAFLKIENPSFGPALNFSFDDILYYKKTEEQKHDWKDVQKDTYHTFCKLGVVDAENKYLDGVSNQLESEVVYHHNITDKNIIFCSTDEALQKYPELFKKYFNTLVKYD